MKTKLIIGLLLLTSNLLVAQINQIAFNVNLIPSYYQNSNPDLLDYYYEMERSERFALLQNISFDFMINENIGFQVGLQAHTIKFKNKYLIEYIAAGSELVRTRDAKYSVKTIVSLYEAPLNLILRKSLNSKIDLDLLIGGSRVLRSKVVRYEVRNKETDETEKTESRLKKMKTMSKFSPQMQFRMQYKVIKRLKMNALVLLKSAKISSLQKFYLGAGMGVSYSLNQ